jgi:protein-disulfide isomerase
MSKRQEMREKRQQQEKINRAIAIGLMVLGAAFFAFLLIWPSIKPIEEVVEFTAESRPNADFNAMGDPNAPITIEEYSDYQCPFCVRFSEETEPQLVENFVKTGKVYFVYRSMGNWVSDNIGGGKTESRDAAMSAYCAGDQGKYWEMHDALFANSLGEDAGFFALRRLSSIAEKVGLNMSEYQSCMDSNKHADRVAQDRLDGEKAITTSPGFDPNQGYGTPSFILRFTTPDGVEQVVLIAGAQPYSVFEAAINSALKEAGK